MEYISRFPYSVEQFLHLEEREQETLQGRRYGHHDAGMRICGHFGHRLPGFRNSVQYNVTSICMRRIASRKDSHL